MEHLGAEPAVSALFGEVVAISVLFCNINTVNSSVSPLQLCCAYDSGLQSGE